VNQFEFVCKIIEPTCELHEGDGRPRVVWQGEEPSCTCGYETEQAAWQAAFAMLDRRKRAQDRRQKLLETTPMTLVHALQKSQEVFGVDGYVYRLGTPADGLNLPRYYVGRGPTHYGTGNTWEEAFA